MSTEEILKIVAKSHGVSVEEVKSEMAEAISYAYENNISFNSTVNREKAQVPSIEEFIRYVAGKCIRDEI